VAGHATRLQCTLADKKELEAELVGRDPLTDIAVIKLRADGVQEFPAATFGDSSQARVGDEVLAMGSPLSLSQSVTLGIVSNTEVIMPRSLGPWFRVTEDGEDVGSFVRWIGHDASIYPGNSGGPLVNLRGEIIGINEIWAGLGGAIPGNLAKAVADELIATGTVKRSWFGLEAQPRLKHGSESRGVLISGTISGSPAAQAGMVPGDILIRIAAQDVDVRFDEELPAFNQMLAALPVGQKVKAVVLRGGREVSLKVTPIEREEAFPKQEEVKQWGITARNISLILAKEMKRDSRNGVLVTSVRPGGPVGEAKPALRAEDVIVEINGGLINNLEELRTVTAALTKGKTEPVPAVVIFERRTERFAAALKVGIKELEDPGAELQKAWLSVRMQVLTRELAEQLGRPELTGFRITEVYPNTAADKAGLQVGDLITAVDGEKLTASAPEQWEELPALIRQYKIGSVAQLALLRGDRELTIPVELPEAPKASREMKKFQDENFEFTVRDITFLDRVKEKWPQDQTGVLADEVKPGGWAAVGLMEVGDLILQIGGTPVSTVEAFETEMDEIEAAKPASIVFQVLRGIHTIFLELEPKWDTRV
jgi:serine protease Do